MNRHRICILGLLCAIAFISGCATQTVNMREKARAQEQLGNSLVREGKLQSGLKELLKAEELDPESPSIQNALGYAYQRLREFNEALVHYKKALRLKEDFPEVENNLGTVYASLGKWDKAITYFQKAARNPTYRTRHFAYENLGSAYHHRGEYEKAIESYKKALRADPKGRYGREAKRLLKKIRESE